MLRVIHRMARTGSCQSPTIIIAIPTTKTITITKTTTITITITVTIWLWLWLWFLPLGNGKNRFLPLLITLGVSPVSRRFENSKTRFLPLHIGKNQFLLLWKWQEPVLATPHNYPIQLVSTHLENGKNRFLPLPITPPFSLCRHALKWQVPVLATWRWQEPVLATPHN